MSKGSVNFQAIRTQTIHTDSELIELWQQGNDGAFELLYKRYVVQLLAFTRKKIDDHEAAQDLVQEIFIGLLGRRDNLQELVSVKSYLYSSLKNGIFNYYRKQLLTKRYEEFVHNTKQKSDDSLLSTLHAKDLEEHLTRVIETLPQQCRTVFKLSRQEHLSNNEIARRLLISENTVEQHMRKALRILRVSLGEYLEVSLILYSFWS